MARRPSASRPHRSAEPAPARGWAEFAPLYDEHQDRLYRIALLLTHGRAAEAEDAVAESMIRVFSAWTARPIDNFLAYARRALVNHVMSQARSAKVASRHLATQRGDRRGLRPVDEAVAESGLVFEALAELPPRQRTAVVLRYYEDLSYDQIAAIMEVSQGTVKSQISMGLQRLRSVLDEGEASDELA